MARTVHFKRFDTSLPAPKYATALSAALDLYARETVAIEPHAVGYVPLNIALQIPPDHWVLLAARSSLHKKGVQLVNGIGVGDYDFRGDGDEYQAALLNFSDKPATIERGERIVQMIVLPREPVELVELKEFKTDNRGGFGSTGA